MKLLIEEKDESGGYRVAPLEQMIGMVRMYEDRVVIFVPNGCGGETRLTFYKTEYPDGNIENLEYLKRING